MPRDGLEPGWLDREPRQKPVEQRRERPGRAPEQLVHQRLGRGSERQGVTVAAIGPSDPVCGAQELVDRLMKQIEPFKPQFHLGEEVVEFLRGKGYDNLREVEVMPENVRFGLPPEIVEAIETQWATLDQSREVTRK